MARRARIESATGIYHVILRGINKQHIFENREDFERFKECLDNAKEKDGIRLLGYCLMDNHVHLLVGAGSEPISASIKRIGVGYAIWFNRKYERSGGLFQDRFRSEPINDDVYLLSALRYIHRNPVKAGMCKRAEDYHWSSYADYVGEGDGLVHTAEILAMFSAKPQNQARLFREFMEEESDAGFLDIDDAVRPSDEKLLERMLHLCGVKNASEIQRLAPDERSQAIRLMRNDGMSIRQIVRLTGVPFGIVRMVRRA